MSLTDDEMGRYIDIVSKSVGLKISAHHRNGVILNLIRLFEQSALFADFTLLEEIEAAPIFKA